MPVYGNAAGGLQGGAAPWAVNENAARAGAKGERRTAEILDRFGADAAILHDLRVPIPGFTANIDHIVVSDDRVLPIDSKVWQPGFYWSFAGTARRGLAKVPHTAKDQSWLTKALRAHLKGTGVTVLDPIVAVWSSSKSGEPSVWALRVPGARAIHADRLEGEVQRFVRRALPNQAAVGRLGQLLTTRTRRSAA